MNKFKVGDRVVVAFYDPINWHVPNDRFPIKKGQVAIVESVIGNGNLYIFDDPKANVGYFEGHLELEELYNSPLMKALR